MRGLLLGVGLTALLAPVFAAPVVPVDKGIQEWDQSAVESFADRVSASAHVNVELPRKSPDAIRTTVGFRLEVLQSEATCGRGNVTIDGLTLPQTLHDDVSTGRGSVLSTTKSTVVGSWAFHCIRVNGIPDAQFMKFAIHSVDGEDVEKNIGFSLLFRQTGLASIVATATDLSLPDELVANPNPRTLQLADAADRQETEADLADLEDLRSQLSDIRDLIREKERAVTQRRVGHAELAFTDCDSLGCVLKALAHRAKYAAHTVYRTMSGGDAMQDFRRDHHQRPWRKHGNRAGPPPWRAWKARKGPHGRPHSVCTYPPPPPPGHHGPPRRGGERPPPPHHARPSPDPPRDFDPPPSRHHARPPPEFIPPPPHDEPFYHGTSHHQPGRQSSPPPPASDFYRRPPHPPRGPPPPLSPGQTRGTRPRLTLATGVFLFALLSVALHSCCRTPARHTARQARKDERRRRRRAAHKHLITRLLARTASHADVEHEDLEEKARLTDAEDGLSPSTREDVSGFRNAAQVVDALAQAPAPLAAPPASDILGPDPKS
ncbi:hypothetical protein BUE80_DR000179 [Diplocarpon rosae]|nr:hypothetical protein BUE80_DR000179 [Diplocarpon rosae]